MNTVHRSDESNGVQSADAEIGATDANRILHGRRWFGACLWVLALFSVALAVSTAQLDWLALLFMGVPALIAAYICLTYGWGEIIAKVELRGDGFSLRLPSYRGYFPFWPARRLEGKWSEVTAIRQCHVEARYFGIRYDYIAHRFETRHGKILLVEQLPNDLSRDARKSSFNLPVRAIAAEFARRAGLIPSHLGRVRGGGLFRNVLFGGPTLPV